MLKTLPPLRQDAIAEHAQSHKLAETAAWLKADGLKVSSNQVSHFLSWYVLRQQLRQNESTVQELLADLKLEQPDITPEQLDSAGQMFFTALSIEQKDASSFVKVRSSRSRAILEAQKLELRKLTEARHQKKFQLEVEIFQFDAAKQALAAVKELKTISASKLTDVEKIDAARQALFGELPPTPEAKS